MRSQRLPDCPREMSHMDLYDTLILISAAVFLVAAAAYVLVLVVRDLYRD